LECERLRGAGTTAGMAEAVSDMSQAFFSAADMHASLGHMPMASSMCVQCFNFHACQRHAA
jgi:hypothetical protein